MTVVARKVSNWIVGDYKVKVDSSANGDVQHVVLEDGSGNIIAPSGSLVTLTHTRPSCTTATSTVLLAANTSRKVGGWIQNNTSTDFWLEIGAAAVASQGIYLQASGGIFLINTAQEIRGIQSSGGPLAPDVYEAS